MAIITISRGTFAGGKRLAELLAQRLAYRVFSREELYDKVRESYGFTGEQAAEIMENAPSHLEFATDRSGRRAIGLRRRQLFFALQSSLCQLLGEEAAIYHGQAGHLLLPGVDHLLRVRLVAPRAMRIDMAMEREKIGRSQACNKIDRVDSERGRWTRAFFGTDWSDTSLHDVVLNLEKIRLDDCAEVISHMTKMPPFTPTSESRQKMRNLCLSARVMAQLVIHPATSELPVEITVERGVVQLLGNLTAEEYQTVLQVTETVAGVKQVKTA